MSNPRHQSPAPTEDSSDLKSGVPRPIGPQPWEHRFCDPFSECGMCCTSYWCPCILHGRTRHRLRNADMATYSCCNNSCMGYAALAFFLSPVQVILGIQQRGEIRAKYGLAGGGCSDCWLQLCCTWCAQVQEEREVVMRMAADRVPVGYQSPGGMVYGDKS